jgi:hypothetical protein
VGLGGRVGLGGWGGVVLFGLWAFYCLRFCLFFVTEGYLWVQ